MKKSIFSSLLVIAICLFLVACGKKTGKELIGSWKNDTTVKGYELIYTFNEDGTGNYNAGGYVIDFIYKVDGDKISLDYTDENMETLDTTYNVDGNKLNIKNANDKEITYVKMKD